MAWITPTTVSTGDVLTASRYNADVQANLTELAPFFSAWTSWTPQVYQNGTRTSTNTASRYLKVGRLVVATARLVITQAGSAGNIISCTLPSAPQATSGDFPVGTFMYFASSGTRYQGAVLINSSFGASPGAIFHVYANNALGNTPNIATANTDALNFIVTYEAAS